MSIGLGWYRLQLCFYRLLQKIKWL